MANYWRDCLVARRQSFKIEPKIRSHDKFDKEIAACLVLSIDYAEVAYYTTYVANNARYIANYAALVTYYTALVANYAALVANYAALVAYYAAF